MAYLKFDISKLERLNDPGRFETLIPRVMWEALGVPSPDVILDIGSGTGLFAREFAQLAPGAVVYAVDMEPQMVDWQLEHTPPELRGRIHPLLSTETAIPLEDDSADVALMINLHHELVDAEASYGEALRVLRRGGRLLVADWRPGETASGPPQHVRASSDQIAAALQATGFTDVVSHDGLPQHSLVTGTKARR